MKTPPIISPEEFPWWRFEKYVFPEKRKKANIGTRQGRRYLDIVTAFDIETTALPEIEESIMYVWQWQFGNWCTVMGRSWEELAAFQIELASRIREDRSLVILVHNLSYEFQFLRTVYQFQPDEVFAIKSRKVLKCTMYERRLEFRCTYLHSNMSLKAYCKKMGTDHQKLSGEEFDYTKRRLPSTPLTDLEKAYCQNDVVGLVEAYTMELQRDNDNLQTIPLTSTGYVRRETKRAMRLASTGMVESMQPDLEQYRLLRDCFRGGNTHANRYYVGYILEDVSSADRSSSYPDVICNKPFPVTQFRWIDNPTIRNIRYHIRKGHAVAFRVAFWNITMKDPYDGFPYLARAKCFNLINGVYDNGRVLCADYLETCLTDLDFQIVSRQYKWQHVKGCNAMWAHYGLLPRPLVLTAIEYYTNKTKLKGVKTEDGSAEYLYARSKELLNSMYGMMAQDPLKFNVLFEELTEGIFNVHWDDPEKILKDYQRRAFLVYQWGVWTTAWARWELQRGLDLAAHLAVYCDTDSVKYLGEVDWTAYNKEHEEASLESGSHATDPQGEEHFMGVFEAEEPYKRFATLGAKKYAYTHEKPDRGLYAAPGEMISDPFPAQKIEWLGITLAGVSKSNGALELATHGGLEAFKDGFVFSDAAALEVVYNDTPGSRWITVDGEQVETGPNIYLRPNTYTLGRTDEYLRLLQAPDLFDKIRQRRI